MTREDYWYLPPDPDDAEGRCVYETGDDTCGQLIPDGLLCEKHEGRVSFEEYVAYEHHYAA